MTKRPPYVAENSIGPNAVTQIVTAMTELGFANHIESIFVAAGTYDWLYNLPTSMVNETRVADLHKAVRKHCLPADSDAILKRAGELTGAYILAHRIPKIAQTILSRLPKSLAAKLLTKAITAHAWTFAGSGAVNAQLQKNETVFSITRNPLCRDEAAAQNICVWHEAVFTTLYRRLIAPCATTKETECCAHGSESCCFHVSY